MNRDAQEVNEIFEDVTVRLFASRISRRHVEKKRRVEKGKRKGKKQRSWQREYVPRFLSRGISWMIAGDLLEPYWYLSNLESYGAAVGVREKSTPRFSPTRVWSKRFVGWKKVWLYTVWSFFFLEPSLPFGRYVEMILLEAVYWFNEEKKKRKKK